MRFTLFHIFLSFGPLVAFAHFDSITFSPVQQCGNFTVLFSGGKPPSSLPLTLTVVPLNGTPIAIDIPDSDWNSSTVTGAAITFLPFPAGTDFVASLDDAQGVGTGKVSDVITVASADDSSCLPNEATKAQPRYTLDGTLSQCAPFDVHWAADVENTPPTIRAFVPNNISTLVNQTSPEAASSGQASYTMDIPEGQQVVLMFSDTSGFRQATDLLVVQGNAQNPTSCLPTASAVLQTASDPEQTNVYVAPVSVAPTKGSLSKQAAIIIGVVSGCAVGSLAIAMIFWLNRERRRVAAKSLKTLEESPQEERKDDRWRLWRLWRPRRNDAGIGGQSTKKGVMASLSKRSGISRVAVRNGSIRILRDPPYTDVKFELVTPAFTKRTANPAMDTTGNQRLSSIPVPITTPLPPTTPTMGELARQPSTEGRADDSQADGSASGEQEPSSLSPADIESILDTARLYSASQSLLRVPSTQAAPNAGGTPALSVVTVASSVALPRQPTPALLTPHTATTYRDPPQAPLPSSALPSPAGDYSFRITSVSSVDSRTVGGNARMARELSGFSFFRTRSERGSVADSFLTM